MDTMFKISSIFCVLVLAGCASTAIQSPLVVPPQGTLGTKEVVIDNPISGASFDKNNFIPLPMANSIALDLAKRFPSIKIIRPQKPATVDGSLQRTNLVFSTDGIGEDYVEVELEVTSWNPGNAFVRWLTSGITNSGEASLSVKATVIKVSSNGVKGAPLAQSVFTTASTGNLLYTGNATTPWTRAADEIATWVGNLL